MPVYRMKVIEIHTDVIDIEANNLEEAEREAIENSDCSFEMVSDVLLISTDGVHNENT
jgi:hypothetical protein